MNKQYDQYAPGKITQDDDELVGGETDIALTRALKEINKSIKDLTLSQDDFQFNIKAEIEKLKVAVNESIELTLIVIIIKQPCLWNAEYAIMYGLIRQDSSIKIDNMSLKKVVDH